PSSVSNRYFLSIRTHGSSWRRRASSSLRRVCSFSAFNRSSRAASHCSRVPVLWLILTSLISTLIVFSFFKFLLMYYPLCFIFFWSKSSRPRNASRLSKHMIQPSRCSGILSSGSSCVMTSFVPSGVGDSSKVTLLSLTPRVEFHVKTSLVGGTTSK